MPSEDQQALRLRLLDSMKPIFKNHSLQNIFVLIVGYFGLMFVVGTQQMEVSKILSEYPLSPVPAVWMYRSIQSNILSHWFQPFTQPWRSVFEKVSKKCEPFKYMGPSTDLIEKFNY